MAEIKATLELKGWNAAQLALRVPVIMERYGTVMDRQLKEEIKAVQYPWPRETKRYGKLSKTTNLKKRAAIRAAQGGLPYRLVGSPRDIVDSGDFLASQRKEFNQSKSQLTFTWDAKSDKGFMYAGLILTGYVVGPRSTVVPPRNWIKPALDKHPLDGFFIREWRKLARNNL